MKNLLFLIAILFLFACDPFDAIIEDQKETISFYESKQQTDVAPLTRSLQIATWNIKFGGGRIDFFFDCFGNHSLMKKTDVENHLKGIAAKIKQMSPDVIFLQEVDIQAKRSAYIDQVQWLLDNTDLNYGIYASQWKSDYVPSDGIGRINTGNAILSRYPLKDGERIALPLIDDQSGLVQYFYLRRNILKANITSADGKTIALLGTHTSAFATDGTKDKQLAEIKKEIDALDAAGTSFVLGGDFNSLPPNTQKLKDFEDDVCPKDSDFSTNDFSKEGDIMLPFFDYKPLIPLDEYAANNADYFSFTADKNGFWNRKLDYMFTNAKFVNGLVHLDEARGGMATMPLSDHAPLSGVLSDW
ncbi:MAG TPA: endonuclease/exonuclease/phosphatase family protein [Saprospiraceae bacterium]|nr:endonuclease/exonuclease/phosphatase family protein [Saprospiraceae bacterium]